MVTDIAAKMQKVEKRRKETPRLKSCKQYQCDWCRRLLQNPSGLIRHKSYCVWNPILRTKTGKRQVLADSILFIVTTRQLQTIE